jgi:hypothetical protein
VVSLPPPPLGDALADEEEDGSIVPTDMEEGTIVVILEAATLGLLDDNIVSTADGATLGLFVVAAEDGSAVLISDFSMVGIALGKSPPPPTTELPPVGDGVGIILGLDVTGHNTVPSGIAWKN